MTQEQLSEISAARASHHHHYGANSHLQEDRPSLGGSPGMRGQASPSSLYDSTNNSCYQSFSDSDREKVMSRFLVSSIHFWNSLKCYQNKQYMCTFLVDHHNEFAGGCQIQGSLRTGTPRKRTSSVSAPRNYAQSERATTAIDQWNRQLYAIFFFFDGECRKEWLSATNSRTRIRTWGEYDQCLFVATIFWVIYLLCTCETQNIL